MALTATAPGQDRGASAGPPSPSSQALSGKPADESHSSAHDSANAAASSDMGVQIDSLIQQCSESINVTVNFRRAEELARQALALSEKAGDKPRTAKSMVYLSAALGYQGRLPEALEIAQESVPIARKSGDKKVLEQVLNTVASANGGLGRYEEALPFFYECLDLAREINDVTMQYMSLLNIGEVYVRSGDPDKAELPLQQSLRLAKDVKSNLTASDPSKKAREMALLNLGAMEMIRQHYRAALSYYEQVHESKPESSLWVVSALQGMAASYEQLGEPQKAIELLDQAVPIAEKAVSGWAYRSLLGALGVNQEKLGDLHAALASENKALALIHEAGGDPDAEWQVESRIAHIDRALGKNEEALDHYNKSTNGIELLRSVALNTEEGQAGVVEQSRSTYAETADLLVELHRESEALEITERGRARAFLEMIVETRVGLADELTNEDRKREDAILTRIAKAQKTLWQENAGPTEKKNETALVSAEADLQKFRVEIRQRNPHYASVRYPDPISPAEIQSKLLDEHTALIEYMLGENRSLAWVVTKHKITTAILPPRKYIEEQISGYRKILSEHVSALTARQSLERIGLSGRKLYDTIFKPLQTDVASSQTVIIVPDGTLGYLPFEALVTGFRQRKPVFLVEQFTVVYGPSASALLTVQEMNRNVSWAKLLLAFGDPNITATASMPSGQRPSDPGFQTRNISAVEEYADRGFSLAHLPYARAEVQGIGKLFPAPQRQLYIGADASEENVKSEKLDDYRFIHFATHAFLDEAHPGRSGIVLSRTPESSEDGVLQPAEIMRLKMNADVVTLSACSTGLGKLVNGEGILGLSRAFFYAGARNVAVSLWNVNDSATAALMKSFYRNLNGGMSKRDALRGAKLSLLHGSQPVWHHPYFWAAFVLDGQGQ